MKKKYFLSPVFADSRDNLITRTRFHLIINMYIYIRMFVSIYIYIYVRMYIHINIFIEIQHL